MTLDEIQTLKGQTIILRKLVFLGSNPNQDKEHLVMKVLEKSVMIDNRRSKVFVPMQFFLQERSKLITEKGKPIVYIPYWFNY